jgi:hypothetical protein
MNGRCPQSLSAVKSFAYSCVFIAFLKFPNIVTAAGHLPVPMSKPLKQDLCGTQAKPPLTRTT